MRYHGDIATRTFYLLLIAFGCSNCYVSAQTIPAFDRDYDHFRKQAFVSYNPQYLALRQERVGRATELGKEVFRLEGQGQPVACAHQILNEIQWLLSATANFQKIDQRLDALHNVLGHPELEAAADKQDPEDGSWGACYTEWFFKVDATYDHFNQEANRDRKPERPLKLLDRVNSPAKLRQYFDAVATSNIAKDGVDHRREFNESMADLMRFILQDRPLGYRWDPRLKRELRKIIFHLRNRDTGWWGERYVVNGRTEFLDYLSLTFHIVRYLDGKVPDLQRVIETALVVKDIDEPAGWLDDGHFTDHNNMDVAVLFGFGWRGANAERRQSMAEQIQKMLTWCLAQSLQPDGSFAYAADDSLEENTYFGVAFLSRIGFFDPSRRFWTTKEFPQSQEVRERILRYIATHKSSGAAGGAYYENALRELNSPKGESGK